MKRTLQLLALLAVWTAGEAGPAKNVILFIGDAAGSPTINAASIYEYDQPLKLFVQQMPHVALMDTSSASEWVTDSAAGMTAIVTGHKTRNSVVSQSETAVPGERDGEWLKTILEHAEERGLSTGVVSNSMVLSATPAACFAHVDDRDRYDQIFIQLLSPRYGDGVDVMFGPGRARIMEIARQQDMDIGSALDSVGLTLYATLDEVPQGARRAAVLMDDGNFDLNHATQRAIDVLSQNSNGFFLMVESDCHTSKLVKGLRNMLKLDDAVRGAVERLKGTDTLIVFTADHSYDFRVYDGSRNEPLLGDLKDPDLGVGMDGIIMRNVRRFDDHTAEEVPVCAQGPGAERVGGYLPNTDLFHIMMEAYGWETQLPNRNP